MDQDHYQVLGVAPEASVDEIKKAYRNLARTQHPDKAKDDRERAELEDRFAAITTAYNVLKDPETRDAYDAQRERRAGGPATSNRRPTTSSGGSAPSGAGSSTKPPAGIDLEKGRRDVAMRAYAQGIKLFQLGDYLRAADFLRTAVQNQPGEAQFQDRLAVALLKARRNFNEAVTAAMKATELDPYKAEYRLHLAELYEAIGSEEKALDAYREVLKWDSNNILARRKVTSAEHGSSTLGRLAHWYRKITGRA